MYKEIAKLVIYLDFEQDNILMPLAQIIKDFETKYQSASVAKEELVTRIYMEIHNNFFLTEEVSQRIRPQIVCLLRQIILELIMWKMV